jgi:2,5-diamino-6-(ribosylamino)-4(3H)-pyrimidinone 5'-phosphate reductase
MVHVVVHNSISADGGVNGFEVDLGLHYGLASTFDADVHLVGSDTMLAAGMETDDPAPGLPGLSDDDPDDGRPLLAVVDSRGRVRTWTALRQAPHWRDRMVALCSLATPSGYLDHLAAQHVDHVIAGDRHVDLAGALAALEQTYAAKRVLVDSGGTLNGALLRAGLVDEVSLLVHPHLVSGPAHASMFRTAEPADPVALRLVNVEQHGDGIVWLRYDVVASAESADGEPA